MKYFNFVHLFLAIGCAICALLSNTMVGTVCNGFSAGIWFAIFYLEMKRGKNMSRLTTYHGDVPVIKDKRFGEAAAKLARYEDDEEKGNLIKLPFKLGGTLYDIFEFVDDYEYPEIYTIDASKVELSMDEKGMVYNIDDCEYREIHFGTTLFESMEEAHAAIEKIKK